MLEKRPKTIVAFRETIALALDTLRSHKLRSFLTLFGVILAVTTLVVVVAIVEGMNKYVAERLANIGSNVFLINQFGIITSHEEFLKAMKRPPVTVEDYEYLKGHLELANEVGAADDRRAELRYANEILEDVIMLGVTANYGDLRGFTPELGRFLNDADDHHRAPVCFIGADVAQRFFVGLDPIGKMIRVDQHAYTVVGVAKAQGTVLGQSRDNFVWIPFGTYLKNWFRGRDSIFILIQAHSPELMQAAQDEARMLLRARRHLPFNDDDNFGIIAPSAIISLWEGISDQLFTVAIGLTSIFLIIGGIVIMNIMLASVVERTREIGIRKALGAMRRHIVAQFVVESACLAAVGGIIGILAAMGIAALVRAFSSLPISTPIGGILTALTLSTSVGLFFGIYPAVRASRLDPIEALRQEV